MISTTADSLHRLARGDICESAVMTWSCPIPYFGTLRKSKIATLGINPSNREFVDAAGEELNGEARRFPTLRSLRLNSWSDASSIDVASIVDACDAYFAGNPYDRWFRVLDAVLSRTGASYYCPERMAVHLDLVPYATEVKWGAMESHQRRRLLAASTDLLGGLLRDSAVELLILSGASVVHEFERAAGVVLAKEHHAGWDLIRPGSRTVRGIGYVGAVSHFGHIELGRTIAVVGYNHNPQSSFGVTRGALTAIASWIGSKA